jgi:acylphosphatase
MSEAAVIRRVIIRGRVQGIGFRAWTEFTAIERGLEGWVRNRNDGAVEALFAGSAEAVAAMIEACLKGPPHAHVAGVDASDGQANDLALRRRGERFSQIATL